MLIHEPQNILPSKPYFVNNSLVSCTTKVKLIRVIHLINFVRKTTIDGTPPDDDKICSLSEASDHQMLIPQNRSIHLSSASNHIFNIISVTWTINVGIVPLFTFYSTWVIFIDNPRCLSLEQHLSVL